jgi:aromatic ring-opening dioxygenase catalytic subunit (LigB family)
LPLSAASIRKRKMAEIVGIYSASHTPVMLNFPDAIPDVDRQEIFDAYRAMGRKIVDARPQALIVLSTDHLHNFFLNNFPAICIGASDSYHSPIEHWLNAEKRVLPGDPKLGAYLLIHALENEFDPAFSLELTLDHGALTPLELAHFSGDIPIVPIMLNCVQPPLPTMRRCYDFGRLIGHAIREYSELDRVAILATGGISHDIATPRMGMVNEKFDRELLRRLESGLVDDIVHYATAEVHEAGNGAEEIRMWMAALGAANGAPFRTKYYKAVSDWYTGIGLGEWEMFRN